MQQMRIIKKETMFNNRYTAKTENKVPFFDYKTVMFQTQEVLRIQNIRLKSASVAYTKLCKI